MLATMPIVFNNFSNLFPPKGTIAGDRSGWNAAGLGDISLLSQALLLDPEEHPFENATIGIGIKTPSGDWDIRRNIPNESGTNFARRAIWPPAIFPGDGGVGILASFDVYKNIRSPNILRNVTLFASGSYLCNPRGTNGTPSIVASLGVPLLPPYTNKTVNSVPDAYTLQGGVSLPIPRTWDKPKLRGLRFRSSINWEGLRSRDLIGSNAGFRTPGYGLAVAPGFTYAYGHHLFIAEVPILFNRHINPGATAVPGIPSVGKNGMLIPAPFNPNRQLGLVAPATLSIRYVRTM